MKFSYGETLEERRTWPTAVAPAMASVKAAKHWCNAQPSDGKYFYHYTNTRWWFSKAEDAFHFSLKWSGR